MCASEIQDAQRIWRIDIFIKDKKKNNNNM